MPAGEDTGRSSFVSVSFSVKLMLAMMAIITFISLATLFVSQDRFSSVSQEYSEEQFARQLDDLRKKQEERLESIAEVIHSETTEVRPQVALAEDEIERFYYDISVGLARFASTFEHDEEGYSDFQPFFRYVDAAKNYWKPNEELESLRGRQLT